MSDKKKKSGDTSYREANAELEQILQQIESGDIDLDELSDKVERAAALLAVCREKLAATELKVKKVVADLASMETGAGGGRDTDKDDDEDA
jgi:exodeoxyribonuclease VII small subunit